MCKTVRTIFRAKSNICRFSEIYLIIVDHVSVFLHLLFIQKEKSPADGKCFKHASAPNHHPLVCCQAEAGDYSLLGVKRYTKLIYTCFKSLAEAFRAKNKSSVQQWKKNDEWSRRINQTWVYLENRGGFFVTAEEKHNKKWRERVYGFRCSFKAVIMLHCDPMTSPLEPPSGQTLL